MCGAYKHIHTMEEKRMQKTNKKYRKKKLLLLVFPISFLSVLVLVLLLLLLFSHLLPISLSLSLSLTYLSASHKAATKASEIATNHGAVLLGRRPPAQPARAQQTWLVMARRSIPMEAKHFWGCALRVFCGAGTGQPDPSQRTNFHRGHTPRSK